jgi:mannose-6-phosphate isomerase-like protein (cupin superfamily)
MQIVKAFETEEIPNPHFMSIRALHVGRGAQFEHRPPETPHRLVNNGKSRLRLLNVKAPRPTKSTHLVAEGKG